jgi:ribosome-associated translation inhibitor RaiA
MVTDLELLINNIEQQVTKFKTKREIEKSKAVTGYYGIQSRINSMNQ